MSATPPFRYDVLRLPFDAVLHAVNDQLICAGQAFIGDRTCAVEASPTRGIIELGTLGGSASVARGINNAGAIVGGALTHADDAHHGFLWRDGVMLDLNTLMRDPAWVIVNALGINDRGDIVALAERDGCEHVVLLKRV